MKDEEISAALDSILSRYFLSSDQLSVRNAILAAFEIKKREPRFYAVLTCDIPPRVDVIDRQYRTGTGPIASFWHYDMPLAERRAHHMAEWLNAGAK